MENPGSLRIHFMQPVRLSKIASTSTISETNSAGTFTNVFGFFSGKVSFLSVTSGSGAWRNQYLRRTRSIDIS